MMGCTAHLFKRASVDTTQKCPVRTFDTQINTPFSRGFFKQTGNVRHDRHNVLLNQRETKVFAL